MRDLQECKAEIFSLSEKRIKQNKIKRGKILGSCMSISLCLCLAVFAAVTLQSPAPDKPDDHTNNGESLLVPEKDKLNQTYGVAVGIPSCIEITSGKKTLKITDREDIFEKYTAIFSAFEKNEAQENLVIYMEKYETNIVFTDKNGEKSSFAIHKGKLISLDKKIVVKLSDAEEAELAALFSIE